MHLIPFNIDCRSVLVENNPVNLFCTVCKTNHYSLGWKEKSKGLNSRAFSVISEILSSIDLPCFEIH